MTEKDKKGKSHAKGILPTYRIEADGRGRFLAITFVGILTVREFSNTAVSIATKRELISVNGKKLEISVFENKTIEIRGEIDNIRFASQKTGRSI